MSPALWKICGEMSGMGCGGVVEVTAVSRFWGCCCNVQEGPSRLLFLMARMPSSCAANRNRSDRVARGAVAAISAA